MALQSATYQFGLPCAKSFPRACLIAAAILLAAPSFRSVLAGPILTFGEISLSAQAGLSGGVPIEDSGLFLSDEFGQVTTLFQPRTWTRYPTSTSAVPQGFLSTFMKTSRFGGVGVSGIQQIHDRSALASTTFSQIVTNTGDADAGLFLDYTIPALEASMLAGASINPGGLPFSSRARAVMFTEHFLADATSVGIQRVFDYELIFERLGTGLDNVDIFRSDDLLGEQGLGSPIDIGDVQGIQYRAFDGERLLTILQPGEFLVFAYTLVTEVSNEAGVDEIGFQAMVGDPFQSSGPGGFQVRLAGATVLPEPSSLALMAIGVMGIGIAMRRRRQWLPEGHDIP
jgi:hypothetical protein